MNSVTIRSASFITAFDGMTDFVPGHWRRFERVIVPEIAPQFPLEIATPAEAREILDLKGADKVNF